jgi:hypothetical protein
MPPHSTVSLLTVRMSDGQKKEKTTTETGIHKLKQYTLK